MERDNEMETETHFAHRWATQMGHTDGPHRRAAQTGRTDRPTQMGHTDRPHRQAHTDGPHRQTTQMGHTDRPHRRATQMGITAVVLLLSLLTHSVPQLLAVLVAEGSSKRVKSLRLRAAPNLAFIL